MSNLEQCDWFWGHDWGKWKEESQMELYRTPEKAIGKMFIQSRTCGRCGLTQYKKLKILI